MRHRLTETGQGLVEAALVMPIFLFLLLAVMQLGWMSLCTSELDGSIAQMQRSAQVAATAEEAVETIVDNSTVLSAERLVVSDYSVSTDSRSSAGNAAPSVRDENSGKGYESSRNDAHRVQVRCTVTYDAGLLMPAPALSGLTTISRSVDFTDTLSREFEVR